MMLAYLKDQLFLKAQRVSLRTALIIPFVILTAVAVSLTGYLSFRNGRQAVNDVAAQLRNEITLQIERQLDTFLETPHLINRLNANAIEQGLVDVHDQDELERYFWEQVQIFDTVTSIYFGNTRGGLADAGREGKEGFLYVIATDGFASGPFRKYAAGEQGERAELLQTVPDFDARTRPWYRRASETGRAAWSDIYILFTGQDMAIAASRPVYGPDGELLGVLSNDIFLSHISDFLQSLSIGKNGEAFIMERSGLLVASSTGERLFTAGEEGQPQRRLRAGESETPLIREGAGQLKEQFGELETINGRRQFEFEIENERYFAQITPFSEAHGLEWLIVVAIPERDFMAQIQANNRLTLLLILVALGVTIIAGMITARRVARPLLSLNKAAKSLAQGAWKQENTASPIKEINELTHSFDNMAAQLTQTLERLTIENTERKRAEAELRQSEARYRSVVEDMPGLLCRFKPGGVLTFVNETYAAYFGREPEELIGQPFSSLIPEENRAEVIARLDSLSPASPVMTIEHPVLTRAGEVRWQRWTNRLLTDDAGRPIAYQAFGLDVTERKRMEKQLRQVQKMEAIGRLAGGIAHDFNNILVPIIGYVDLVMMQLSPDDKLYAHLSQIKKAADRAAKLTRQILAFSRKQVLEMQILDLNAVITDFKTMIRSLIGENIALQTNLAPALYPVKADKGQIEQILMNLMVNARDAMPAGGKLTIETGNAYLDEAYIQKYRGAQEPGHYAMLAVSDTGHGMDKKTQQQIFDPFFTTKERGKGTGLGLATVFGIVKQHGGNIWVYSEPEKGTTFKIYLPKSEVTEETADTVMIDDVATNGTETILVVEDEEMVRELVCETLAARGYDVIEAHDPQEALQAAEQGDTIHLLLTDVIMPQMNGQELYREVIGVHPDIKVMYMSGYTDDVIVHHGVLDEAVNFLQKPFTVHDLLQNVRQILD